MNEFQRGSASVTVDVDVSADDFWKLLRDWPAVMAWTQPKNTSSPIIDVTLKQGHDVNTLPCTRIIHLDNSKGGAATFEETLLHAYPASKRIYYTCANNPDGINNYMATTFVDELNNGRARVTCESMFDFPANNSVEGTIRWLETVYEHSIIRGIEGAIKNKKR